MAAKEQTCSYCGEALGVFEHSHHFDGPLSCGQKACNRYVRAEQDAQREEAHARVDDGGPWW